MTNGETRNRGLEFTMRHFRSASRQSLASTRMALHFITNEISELSVEALDEFDADGSKVMMSLPFGQIQRVLPDSGWVQQIARGLGFGLRSFACGIDSGEFELL